MLKLLIKISVHEVAHSKNFSLLDHRVWIATAEHGMDTLRQLHLLAARITTRHGVLRGHICKYFWCVSHGRAQMRRNRIRCGQQRAFKQDNTQTNIKGEGEGGRGVKKTPQIIL